MTTAQVDVLAGVRAGIDALCIPGEVYELRALKTKRGAWSGYFNDFDALAKAALDLDRQRAPGIYCTLNPVTPALLARAANRAKPYAQATTQDADVLRRTRLLLDCDWERPSGISTTDAEHDAALERVDTIADSLVERGWPEPLRGDSGNGGHAIFAIDLPNDAQASGLLSRVLQTLAWTFKDGSGDGRVKVDEGVFNAARITKLFGTTARKGDDVPERPHRRSRILSVPSDFGQRVVTRHQLEALVNDLAPHEEACSGGTADGSNSGGFNLERFIAQNIRVKRGPERQGDRMRWILEECVFDPAHVGTSAAIFRLPSGAIAYKCQHASCLQRKWADVREKFEPGGRDQRTYTNGGLSDSATNGKSAQSEEPSLVLTRADCVPIKRIAFLTADRIPFAAPTLFDGPGGVGKTQFLTGIIAAATVGRDFFTGDEIEPQSALIVGVEDACSLTASRLRLYGADMARVHFVNSTRIGGTDFRFVLPAHIGVLERALLDTGSLIVYVDALFSHVEFDGEGRMSQQVRAALYPIGEMLKRTGAALLAIRHWSKQHGAAVNRALGSIEFTNFARSTFTLGEHQDGGLVVCAHTKRNWSKTAPTVAFKKVVHEVLDDDGKPFEVCIAEGVHAIEGVTSDDLTMRQAADPDEKNAAAEWLRDHLADNEERVAGDVLAAATKEKVGDRTTLWRAARALGVVIERTATYPSKGTWRLPAASERQGAEKASPASSGCTPYVYATTGGKAEADEAETLVTQGSDSRCAVVAAKASETTGATTATGGLTPPEASEPSDDDLEPEWSSRGMACKRCGGLGICRISDQVCKRCVALEMPRRVVTI